MGRFVFIICHFIKPLDWLKEHEHHIIHNGVDRPNEGREPGAFFYWIHTSYDKIEDDVTYVFLQDNPFEHCNLYDSLEYTDFKLLGKLIHSNPDGTPHHPGLPVGEKYEAWTKQNPKPQYEFAPGGQFLISGKLLKTRTHDFYKYMEQEMSKHENPWVMERLWGYLWYNRGKEAPAKKKAAPDK